ncbi:hypothetical protein Calkro_2510 [Caldicellulosiruptor kronotskyensis 2002]|uniref:Uncharacterized protein n=1 Tax=Caldicellulosiruptor kronotskyensis (strain DSM 18902 / VKM B-2412 / 2002) TaxID=632348 RepID=E4SHT8_CALK2|nr:hypothetical protein [Caldicellulosiruptor kronotskyensis]ADQ47313.1 hypothetical protein Calkro_2510 [Caldicellulosiruptor kronotskyensis 2002]
MSIGSLLGASIMLNGIVGGFKIFATVLCLSILIKGILNGFKKGLQKSW